MRVSVALKDNEDYHDLPLSPLAGMLAITGYPALSVYSFLEFFYERFCQEVDQKSISVRGDDVK